VKDTYWNHKGKYEKLAKQLHELIPTEGEVKGAKNKALDKFRRASNCYYDLYNNGLCNRRAQFRQVFGFPVPSYMLWLRHDISESIQQKLEDEMSKIILAAAKEQRVGETHEPVVRFDKLNVEVGIKTSQATFFLPTLTIDQARWLRDELIEKLK